MRIALIGFTPREEVIARALRQRDSGAELIVFILGKNLALEELADTVYPVDLDNLRTSVVDRMRALQPDVVFVGPDKLSIAGVTDALRSEGIPTIGSDAGQIRVETSKAWLRVAAPETAAFYPPHRIVRALGEAEIRDFIDRHPRYVVKYDGPFREIGGGVRLSGLHLNSLQDAVAYAHESIADCGCAVLEEQIEGMDFSVNALSAADGSVYFFAENLCYKLRNEGNTGPNTSGTGSVCLGSGLPYLGIEQVERAHFIVREVVGSMRRVLGRPFVTGLNVDMRCSSDGRVYLLEVNARFAGAGTLSTVMALCADFPGDILSEALGGTFYGLTPRRHPESSVSVFAYPWFFPSGADADVDKTPPVKIPTRTAVSPDVNVYTGWVGVLDSGPRSRLVRLKNSTTLLFETRAPDVQQARARVYQSMAGLDPALEYRRDIGRDLQQSGA